MINQQKFGKSVLLTGFVSMVVCLATLPVVAQETERATVSAVQSIKAEPEKMKRKTVNVKVVKVDNLDQLRADIKQCGTACKVGGSGSISAGEGGTRDHECDDDGNCHCFGAIDCVAMSKICAPDTIGCNDQGCLCTEGEGDG